MARDQHPFGRLGMPGDDQVRHPHRLAGDRIGRVKRLEGDLGAQPAEVLGQQRLLLGHPPAAAGPRTDSADFFQITEGPRGVGNGPDSRPLRLVRRRQHSGTPAASAAIVQAIIPVKSASRRAPSRNARHILQSTGGKGGWPPDRISSSGVPARGNVPDASCTVRAQSSPPRLTRHRSFYGSDCWQFRDGLRPVINWNVDQLERLSFDQPLDFGRREAVFEPRPHLRHDPGGGVRGQMCPPVRHERPAVMP